MKRAVKKQTLRKQAIKEQTLRKQASKKQTLKKEAQRKNIGMLPKSSEIQNPDAENPQKGIPKMQTADVNSKTIFENPVLFAQFLRDYSGIEELKDVQPDDIKKIKLRYHLFDEAELNSDSVVEIMRHDGEGMPVYIVSLIDHKSYVDYNVAMQFFYYFACIYKDWEKRRKKEGQDCRTKGFRYPVIYPIVYYEGTESWTADVNFSSRIFGTDSLKAYTPEFKYKVVNVHEYSNKELLDKSDEMSLLMLLNKVQTSGDIVKLRELDFKNVDAIIADTDPEVLEIFAGIVQSLCRKLNVQDAEADDYIEKIRGEKRMGYLFENMEKMDIQEERRNTERERKRADEAETRLNEAKKRANETKTRLNEAEKRADEAENRERDSAALTGWLLKQNRLSDLEKMLSNEKLREKLLAEMNYQGRQ